jgi:cytoskeletal protein CcmA (bactofilin family)
MATLYYNNAAGDFEWATLGNWWANEACTVPATSLPGSSDSVVATVSINADSRTVVNFTMTGSGSLQLYGALTVTGVATFSDSSPSYGGVNNAGTITGNAVFNGVTANRGIVTGNATFNGSATNGSPDGFPGTVNGNATFNGLATNDGSTGYIGGNATFTGSAYTALSEPPTKNVSGTITFSSPTPVTFNFTAVFFMQDSSSWTFSGGTPTWNVSGGMVGTYDAGQPKAVVNGNLVASGGFQLVGDVTGTLTMTGCIHGRGTVSGSASYTASYVWGTFDGGTHPALNPWVVGSAHFRGGPYGGSYAEYATFTSGPGEITFDIASARAQLKEGDNVMFGGGQQPTIVYEKGVNGSSILGIV